jgi:rhodanese-related sulfurtransferase
MKISLFVLLLVASAITIQVRAADAKTAAPPSTNAATKVKIVGVEEFDKLRANKTNVVLDVRSSVEFKAGHIPGAMNIDVNSPEFDKKVGELDKNKTYLVHCAAGTRSARACKKLERIGFKNLFDLHPGFNGWEEAGKPVEK